MYDELRVRARVPEHNVLEGARRTLPRDDAVESIWRPPPREVRSLSAAAEKDLSDHNHCVGSRRTSLPILRILCGEVDVRGEVRSIAEHGTGSGATKRRVHALIDDSLRDITRRAVEQVSHVEGVEIERTLQRRVVESIRRIQDRGAERGGGGRRRRSRAQVGADSVALRSERAPKDRILDALAPLHAQMADEDGRLPKL